MNLKRTIKLFDPSIGKEEYSSVTKTLRSKFWASGTGVGNVSEFEKKFNHYIGSESCLAVNSGTAALHLSLSLINIKNKEVILPSLSFVSTAHAVIYNGGKPVFVDVDPETLCIDYDMIKKSISKNTKAILPVHFGGIPCEMDKISQLGLNHGITLVEDAAHAAGSSYNNKKIGTHGSTVCFSFHPVKNLAMPGGGAITLNGPDSKKNEQIIRSRRWCGISNRKGSKYGVTDLGWNYYMNEIAAAIGIVQLKKLDNFNSKRKKIAKRYDKEISNNEKIPLNQNCSYHLYWIQVNNRDEFMKKMQENGIETGIHYLPIHQMKYYHRKSKLPVTEKIGRKIVSLPMHPNLEESDLNKIIKLTNNFAN